VAGGAGKGSSPPSPPPGTGMWEWGSASPGLLRQQPGQGGGGGEAAWRDPDWSHPAHPAPGLCIGACRFGWRQVEGQSWLESVWAGEMGVWVGHTGLICWWVGGTRTGEWCWDGDEARSTDCMAWECSGLWCRGHARQRWCPTGLLWGGTVPGKWHCPAHLDTHNLPLIPSGSVGQGLHDTMQGGCGAHPGRAGAGLAPEHRGQALPVWTDTVHVSARALLVLPMLAYSHSCLPGR